MTISTAEDPLAAQKALVEQLDKSGWDLIVGDAFVRGMRDIGYKSTSYALAELIDNSVQADASWVDVLFGFDKGKAMPAQIKVPPTRVHDPPVIPARGRERAVRTSQPPTPQRDMHHDRAAPCQRVRINTPHPHTRQAQNTVE